MSFFVTIFVQLFPFLSIWKNQTVKLSILWAKLCRAEFWSQKVLDLTHFGPIWPTLGPNLTALVSRFVLINDFEQIWHSCWSARLSLKVLYKETGTPNLARKWVILAQNGTTPHKKVVETRTVTKCTTNWVTP